MPCAKSIGIMSWPKFVSGVATPLPAMVGIKDGDPAFERAQTEIAVVSVFCLENEAGNLP